MTQKYIMTRAIHLGSILLTFAAITLTGCAKRGSELIGAWSSYGDYQYGAERCEFFKDRSCSIETEGHRLAGTWAALDDKRLRVTITSFSGQSMMMFATVTGDELVLDGGGSNQSRFVREGSSTAGQIRTSIQEAISEREIKIEAEKRVLAEQRAAEERARQTQIEAERLAREKRMEAERLAREKQQEGQRAFAAAESAWGRGMYPEAIAEYERAMAAGNSMAVKDLAWRLATCSDPAHQNGKRAVELALQATKLMPEERYSWGTLAAAYARNGQFEAAVSTQLRALSMGDIPGGEERLKLYRENKAYQDR